MSSLTRLSTPAHTFPTAAPGCGSRPPRLPGPPLPLCARLSGGRGWLPAWRPQGRPSPTAATRGGPRPYSTPAQSRTAAVAAIFAEPHKGCDATPTPTLLSWPSKLTFQMQRKCTRTRNASGCHIPEPGRSPARCIKWAVNTTFLLLNQAHKCEIFKGIKYIRTGHFCSHPFNLGTVVLLHYSNSKSTAGHENTEQFSLFFKQMATPTRVPPPAHPLTYCSHASGLLCRAPTATPWPHRRRHPTTSRLPRPQRDPTMLLWPPSPPTGSAVSRPPPK